MFSSDVTSLVAVSTQETLSCSPSAGRCPEEMHAYTWNTSPHAKCPTVKRAKGIMSADTLYLHKETLVLRRPPIVQCKHITYHCRRHHLQLSNSGCPTRCSWDPPGNTCWWCTCREQGPSEPHQGGYNIPVPSAEIRRTEQASTPLPLLLNKFGFVIA